MGRIIKKSLKVSLIGIIILAGVLGVAYGIGAYSGAFKTSLQFEKNSDIFPDEEVKINFSQVVSVESYSKKIDIAPRENVILRWENSNKTLVLSPKKGWKMDTVYTVKLSEGKTKLLTKIGAQELAFSTLKKPSIKSVIPSDGSKDVVFDIEDPIVVDFEKTFEDFWIKFSFSPAVEYAYEINPEKTQFKIIPKGSVKDGTKYDMTVDAKYIKDADDGFQEVLTTSFETLPPPPETWEKDLSLRVEQAKKFTRAKIKEGKYIDINLASQIMSTFENGNLLDSFMISSGKRGMETPKGEHQIYNKSPRPWSKKYSLYMPFWMAITSSGEYGIHELPEWPGGYKEGANHLGTPVSHGCVRLGIGAAKTVYDWADIGTPVVVY